MKDLHIFCPHCGYMYPTFVESMCIIMFMGWPSDIDPPVIRRCLSCRQWEFPKVGKQMMDMILRED